MSAPGRIACVWLVGVSCGYFLCCELFQWRIHLHLPARQSRVGPCLWWFVSIHWEKLGGSVFNVLLLAMLCEVFGRHLVACLFQVLAARREGKTTRMSSERLPTLIARARRRQLIHTRRHGSKPCCVSCFRANHFRTKASPPSGAPSWYAGDRGFVGVRSTEGLHLQRLTGLSEKKCGGGEELSLRLLAECLRNSSAIDRIRGC